MNNQLLAFDKGNRRIDSEGRLHVEKSNISKAQVSPYFGREIPEYTKLGLDANRVYYMLRDPDELAKAVKTFNNMPLMSTHVAVHAHDNKKEYVVGAISNAAFDGEFLTASMSIWDNDFIESVNDESQAEISCGYRYKAKMEKGSYEGVSYDGIMTEIEANHVALVSRGRAGSEVRVAYDAQSGVFNKEGFIMKKDEAILIVAAALTTPEQRLAFDACLAKDEDDEKEVIETEEEKKARLEKEAAEGKEKPEKLGMDEAAVNEAIKLAVDAAKAETRAEMKALHEARKDVESLVGDVAFDTAEEVYKFALDNAKVDTENVSPTAYKTLVGMLKNGATPAAKIVMDSETKTEIAKAFPSINRLK